MKQALLSLGLCAVAACTQQDAAPKPNDAARVENEGDTPYNKMRLWVASAMCALTLGACSDTHQSVPVDEVSISNVGEAK